MALSFMTLSLAVPIVLIVITVNRYIQNRRLSPLREIPGPFFASLTEYWLVFVDLAGRRTETVHEWHRRYGSTVRIGPNEVSFSDQASVNEIYCQNTPYLKAPMYTGVALKPLGMFGMQDKAAHSARRGLLSHAFSQSNINACAPLVGAQVNKVIGIVSKSVGQPLDVLKLFRLFSLDVVGELFFGQSFGGLESDKPPEFLADMEKTFIALGIEWDFPWIYRLLLCLPFTEISYTLKAHERIVSYGEKAYQDYLKRYGPDSGRKDLLTKILSPKSDAVKMTHEETVVEVTNEIFAGTDTTSTTLTYLCWELTRHPEWQHRLRKELRSSDLPAGLEDRNFLPRLTELPVLNAVVSEALRLWPAAPRGLPRVAPPGGCVLGSHALPQGTVVSAQAYTTHRNPTAFPNPEKFDPKRWLESEAPGPEMKELFMPFSKGTRACIGQNLAMLELKLVTATLLKRYFVAAAPETTADSMEMRDHFLIAPKAGKCDLIFES